MSEFKIDEEHIELLSDKMKRALSNISQDVDLLADKNEDIFTRYILMDKLQAVFLGISFISNMHHDAFASGYNSHHELIKNSEKAIENEWGIPDLGGDDFFTTEEKEIRRKKIALAVSSIRDAFNPEADEEE